MVELKGSDIPRQRCSEQQRDPRLKSDSSSEELHAAKPYLPANWENTANRHPKCSLKDKHEVYKAG